MPFLDKESNFCLNEDPPCSNMFQGGGDKNKMVKMLRRHLNIFLSRNNGPIQTNPGSKLY